MKTNKTLNDFISLLSFTNSTKTEESLKELKIIYKTHDILSAPSEDDVLNNISFLNSRDSLRLSVKIGDEDTIDYYSSQSYGSFFREVNNRLEIREDEEIEIELVINKNIADGKLSVYFPEKLFNYLSKLNINGLLYVINQEFSPRRRLILESQTEIINVKTNSIWLTNESISFEPKVILRTDIINSTKSVCHFNLTNQYEFLPEDFKIIESSHTGYSNLFNRLCIVYSIGYLYDITTVEDDLIFFKLNGYKSIKGNISFNDILDNCTYEYYNIYQWCYDGGNLIDKIGLSRNIISLHLNKPEKADLIGNPYQSVLSSYKVYEKQNIKQYIEIRNKISGQLLGFHDRANKIIENFASGFQKSALALISFYISAIVIKLLGKPELINIFTLEATILSTLFIVCSFIYYKVSIWEVNEQKNRFVNSYNNLKQRYLDLLTLEDIQKILNGDKEFNSDVRFIDSKQRMYSKMWKAYLILLLSITFILFGIYNITQLIHSRIWGFLFEKCMCR